MLFFPKTVRQALSLPGLPPGASALVGRELQGWAHYSGLPFSLLAHLLFVQVAP